MYYLYILKCRDNSLYTGITTDVRRRFSEHKNKKGGHYTASHIPVAVLYSETCGTRSNALKREAEIKRWSHIKKLALIKSPKKR